MPCARPAAPDPQRPARKRHACLHPRPSLRSSPPPRPWPSSRSPPAAAARPRPPPPRTTPTACSRPGTLRVGTLTDAPPNVFLKDGKFTGFDNDLLTAVAGKLGLKVRVRRHRLLRAPRAGQERQVRPRLLLDHHHRGAQEDRRLHQRLRLRLLRPRRPEGLRHHVASTSSRASASSSCRARSRTTTPPSESLNPVRVPDYNGALNQLKAGTADAWVAPAEIGEKTAKDSGGKVTLAAKQLSSAPTAFAVAPGNDGCAHGARTRRLDQVIKDGTWTKLQEQYYPGRPVPKDFKPGQRHASPFAPVKAAAGELTAPMDILQTLRETFLDLDAMGEALPELLTVGPAQHPPPGAVSAVLGTLLGMLLAVVRAVPVALAALAGARLHRHLPRPAGGRDDPAHRRRPGAGRPGDLGTQPLPARHPRPLADRRAPTSARSSAPASRAWRPASSRRPARWGSRGPPAMRLVVIPQGVRRVLPALVNQLIALIKESSPGLLPGAARQPARPVPHRPGRRPPTPATSRRCCWRACSTWSSPCR